MIHSNRLMSSFKGLKSSLRILVLLVAVTVDSGAFLQAQQSQPASGDPDLARIAQLFKDAERYNAESKFDLAAYALIDVLKISGKHVDQSNEYDDFGRAYLRALMDLSQTEKQITGEIDKLLTQIEAEVNKLPKPDASSLKRIESFVQSLKGIGKEPAKFTDSIRWRYLDFVKSCSSTIMKTEEEQAEHLQKGEELKKSADQACAATERATAERHILDAGRSFERLETLAKEAKVWQRRRERNHGAEQGGKGQTTPDNSRQNPNQPAEEGVIDETLLDGFRRELDKAEDRISRLKEAADEISEKRSGLLDAWDQLEPVSKKKTEIQNRVGALMRAFGAAQQYYQFKNPPNSSWVARGETASEKINKLWRALNPIIKEFSNPEVRDAASTLAQTGPYVEEMRKAIDETGARIESTDQFARLCLSAYEDGRKDLDRAKACLQTLAARTQLSSGPTTPVNQNQQSPGSTTSGGTSRPSTTSQTPTQTPAQPPAPPPSPSQSQQQAAQNAVPPVAQEAFGGIKIQGGSNRIFVGQSVRFIATDMGNRIYKDVIWNSHNEEFLSLGQDGTATGLKGGKLLIQAKTLEDPTVIAYFEVEVVDPSQKTGTAQTGGTQAGTAPAGGAGATQTVPGQSGGTQAGTTGQTGGGFGDKGLQVGTDKDSGKPEQDRENEKGQIEEKDKNKRDSVSLLGEGVGSQKPPDKQQDLGPDGGFGNKGLETGQKEEKDKPSGGSGGQTDQSRGQGQSGTQQPGGGTAAPAVRSLIFQGGAQPAAWHIFATGSRMGWAAAYSRFTDGPADQDIIDHLVMAGEHAMWANRQSYPPYQAWPNWSQIKLRCRIWADQLVRSRQGELREQLALAVSSYADSMADQVTFQVKGDIIRTANCDGAYMRLGFHIAYGQTSLQLAEGAGQTGQFHLIDKARQDAVNHLRLAARILTEYESTEVVTGVCADLKDVRDEIASLLSQADLASQIRMTGQAWTTASDRIRALSGLTAQTQTAPQPERETQASPARPAQTQQQTQAQASVQEVWSDPGELEGVWVTDLARYRFTKQGNEYIGTLEKIFTPPPPSASENWDLPFLLSAQGYKEGDVVYRGTRAGSNSYRGTYRKRLTSVWENGTGPTPTGRSVFKVEDVNREVTFTVMGDYLDIRTASDPSGNLDIWTQLLRVDGVMWLPDFKTLTHNQRNPLFSNTWHSKIWFVASRISPSGETQYIVFHDYLDPASQAEKRNLYLVDSALKNPHPSSKAFQDYMKAHETVRKKIEKAGFKIIFGPDAKYTSINRIAVPGSLEKDKAKDNLLGVPIRR